MRPYVGLTTCGASIGFARATEQRSKSAASIVGSATAAIVAGTVANLRKKKRQIGTPALLQEASQLALYVP